MDKGACVCVARVCVFLRLCMNAVWVCVALSLRRPLRVAAVSRVTWLYSLKPTERIIPR